MRLLTPTLALVLLAAGFASLTPAQDAKGNLIKQEWKKLQGTWALASLEVGGKAVPAEKLKEASQSRSSSARERPPSLRGTNARSCP
jgi:hypothetical protein